MKISLISLLAVSVCLTGCSSGASCDGSASLEAVRQVANSRDNLVTLVLNTDNDDFKNVVYDLNDIIMTAKNPDTGNVSCKAVITGTFKGKSASRNITYTIEKTTDGAAMASVYGLLL